MGVKIVKVSVSDKPTTEDKLRVNLGRKKKEIKLAARLVKFRDKDTRQIIYFLPSLQITGYGATDQKAKEMLDFSVDEYFTFLMSLNQKKLDEELRKLGWKNVPYAHKQFSKMFVSSDGELQDYNAVADEVEHLTLQV